VVAPLEPELDHLLAKIRRRLIPFLFLLYIVAYLDRINVGFAALQMNEALGLSATAFGLGAGVFFLSYTAFEIPSNVILARVGARFWIARIMISWGLVSAGMMFARTAAHFYVLRFLLGAAEAGFFPGIIYYLTQWVPRRERARTIAAFMTATLMAGVIGGPLSGALLSMHGLGGLDGWQWLFLLEGAPAVACGFVVRFWLPDGPADAPWLSAGERRLLLATLAREADGESHARSAAWAALRSGRTWLLAGVYFTVPVALYTISFWLPQIVRTATRGSDFEVGLLSAIPYLVGAAGMLITARHSDRTGERRWHLVVAALAGGIGLAASAAAHSASSAIAALSVAMLGLASMFGPFWALATSSIGGVGAAAGIALINSMGNTGGFLGPSFVGYVRDVTGSFAWGLVATGAVLALVPFAALAVSEPQGSPDSRTRPQV
jgi:sugar phosphate permease